MSETTNTFNISTSITNTTALPTDALLATAAIVDAAKAIAAQFTPWDKDPKTKGAALHFASLANDKAGKLLHEAVQSLAKGLYLNSLAESLPEAAAPTAKAHPVYEVGAVVSSASVVVRLHGDWRAKSLAVRSRTIRYKRIVSL